MPPGKVDQLPDVGLGVVAAMPLAVRRRFANEMIVAAARVALGIDEWEQYQ